MKLNRQQAAKVLGVSRHHINMVEIDEQQLNGQPRENVPWTGEQELRDYEVCLMYRLRSDGVTQTMIATAICVSRGWVNRMERGTERCDALLQYWGH